MNQKNHRFALVYNHQNVAGRLKRVQVSDTFAPFPDSVQVGDLLHGEPIVALAAAMDDFAALIADENALCTLGKQRLAELEPQRQWRYYTLFRFYIVDPQYAVTVEEKVAIALLGETQTVRVIGHDTPDALDTARVWAHLEPFETPAGTVLQGGPLDGSEASRCRSLDWINVDFNERYAAWKPLPTTLLDNH